MEIIDQHTKKIMEGCKERAADAGLRFESDTLEYIVSNQDLIELSPKGMVPTLYDYWVHDLEVIKGRKEYELYPHNPYETVINSRPALSFYNDNNPDWLNVMIFYHVLGHIDFMQNNHFFRHTWGDDFVGQALADKRLINHFRTRHGRWVDYVIEFARGIDNLTGYYRVLSEMNSTRGSEPDRLDFYFDVFLQQIRKVSDPEYLKEIDRYNAARKENPDLALSIFLSDIKVRFPEFEALFDKYKSEHRPEPKDLLEYLVCHSPFLNRDENEWMKSVIHVVRNTALYFEPQRRTKILNEGWASYWHFELFLQDDRILGHEAEFAKVNAMVTALPRVGVNPYAIGWRLFQYVEEMADKGRLSWEFEKLLDAEERKHFDRKTGKGRETLFKVRSNYCDFHFVNRFLDQDFVDLHHLVVVGERINQKRMTREYYIKSKKADDYRNMILRGLIHPPHVTVDPDRTINGALYLVHHFEEKPLLTDFIPNVLIGLEYLWGGPVRLETHEITRNGPRRVRYNSENRKVNKDVLD